MTYLREQSGNEPLPSVWSCSQSPSFCAVDKQASALRDDLLISQTSLSNLIGKNSHPYVAGTVCVCVCACVRAGRPKTWLCRRAVCGVVWCGVQYVSLRGFGQPSWQEMSAANKTNLRIISPYPDYLFNHLEPISCGSGEKKTTNVTTQT